MLVSINSQPGFLVIFAQNNRGYSRLRFQPLLLYDEPVFLKMAHIYKVGFCLLQE